MFTIEHKHYPTGKWREMAEEKYKSEHFALGELRRLQKDHPQSKFRIRYQDRQCSQCLKFIRLTHIDICFRCETTLREDYDKKYSEVVKC